MTPVVTPSAVKCITPGQIGKFYDLFVAALSKSGLPSEPTQQVLESQGGILADECVVLIRTRVEAIGNMIVRRVKVDRNRTPQQVLDATGCKQYLDREVVDAMPRGEGEEVDVYSFKPNKSAYDEDGLISDEQVAKEYELRGLKPDPYAQAAMNEAFADEHPNASHWKDAEGNWCYAAFPRWRGERDVRVFRNDFDWNGGWEFSGVRK